MDESSGFLLVLSSKKALSPTSPRSNLGIGVPPYGKNKKDAAFQARSILGVPRQGTAWAHPSAILKEERSKHLAPYVLPEVGSCLNKPTTAP